MTKCKFKIFYVIHMNIVKQKAVKTLNYQSQNMNLQVLIKTNRIIEQNIKNNIIVEFIIIPIIS